MARSLAGITCGMLLGIALDKLAPGGQITITLEDAEAFGIGAVSQPIEMTFNEEGTAVVITAKPKPPDR